MAETIAQWARRRRGDLGLTQPEVASKMGRERSTVSHIERGRSKRPTLPTMAQLAAALETPLLQMLRDTGMVELYQSELESEQTTTEQDRLIAWIKIHGRGLTGQKTDEILGVLAALMGERPPGRRDKPPASGDG